MPSNYPTGLDSLTNPSASDQMNVVEHDDQHANANDAIEAIQAELGLSPSGSSDTVVARLDALPSATQTLTNKTIALASNTVSGSTASFNSALSDGDFATLAGSETLTNKTVALGSNTVSGTTAQFNTALSDGDFATLAGSETLTGKTISLGSNTVSGTTAQFNTANSDGDFATQAGTETLTNKTVNLSSNTLTGTTAQFNTALSDNDFATLAGSETLTNKTLTTPTIASFTNATHDHSNAAGGGNIAATSVTIVDSGNNYSATNTETALAEVADRVDTAEAAIDDLEDDTDPRARVLTAGSPGGTARSWIRLEDEFFGSSIVTQQIGQLGWGTSSSGTGAAVANVSAASNRSSGIKQLSTGTDTTGFTSIQLAANQIDAAPVFHCRWVFRIPTLSDGTNTFWVSIGLGDTTLAGNSGQMTDGFYLTYTNGTNSGKFQSVASDAGSRTATDTGITVGAGTWYTADAICNGAGTVTWYMADGTNALAQVSQHTSSTNFPDAGDVYAPLALIEKSAGTTARTLDVDYFFLYLEQAR